MLNDLKKICIGTICIYLIVVYLVALRELGDVLEYSKNQLYILRLCDDYFGIIFPVLAIFSIYFENKNIAGVSLILYCLFENINIIVNSVINIWCKGNVLLFVGNFILCIFIVLWMNNKVKTLYMLVITFVIRLVIVLNIFVLLIHIGNTSSVVDINIVAFLICVEGLHYHMIISFGKYR